MLLGEHDYYSTDETDHWVARVEKIVDHPDYDEYTTSNDFSMLRLKEAVDFEAYPHIRPVCLPYNKDEVGKLKLSLASSINIHCCLCPDLRRRGRHCYGLGHHQLWWGPLLHSQGGQCDGADQQELLVR